jgi:FkbM family methyltransferase
MRRWIRSSEGAQHIYWAIRKFLGLPPKSHHELLYWLNRHGQKFGYETPGTFRFPWGPFEYVSLGQLIIQYQDIFQKGHYAFKSKDSTPVIIDCGGNVGFSALWFKQNYPTCRLTVFEPDKNLFQLIQKNLAAAGFKDVVGIQKAAWVKDGSIGFDLRGDDRGKIVADSTLTVDSVDLAAWLPETVDVLKLDVEGAEFEIVNHLCATGAIQRIESLVCELHVLRGEETKTLRLIQELIDAGMGFSINSAMAVPSLGLAREASPFAVIGRNQVLIELYAWKKTVSVAKATPFLTKQEA